MAAPIMRSPPQSLLKKGEKDGDKPKTSLVANSVYLVVFVFQTVGFIPLVGRSFWGRIHMGAAIN